MQEISEQRELVEKLAEEFVRRYRSGERPSLAEYIQAYPDHAAEIKDLFPALVMMEDLAPSDDSVAGPAGPPSLAPAGAKSEERRRIGDYVLLREIGRGGMGVVYEAEQLSLGRRVALKVLTMPPGESGTVLERFRREARAAAQLHHTNIVPVHEVGQEGEHYFYAMQLIVGQGLDEVVKELRQLRAASGTGTRPITEPGSVALSLLTARFETPNLAEDGSGVTGQGSGAAEELNAATLVPRPSPLIPDPSPLTPPLSATLHLVKDPAPGSDASLSSADSRGYYWSVGKIGVQAAEALVYAHQRGIIHRDVKPSNLLLDTAGVVWVTDFGLAKMEDAGLTQTGDIVGTVRYMAPERFRGSCDRRADVYGLGLTLYELATLTPAFDCADRLVLIEQIGRQEPRRPRAIDPRIPRDLETIILKAIDKEPGRRYQTAEELANDLRCLLEDRPIRARRSAVWERTWRWCRRNRLLAGLSAAVAVLLLVAGLGFFVADLLRGERDRAVIAEEEARSAEADARHLLDRAQRAEGEVKFRSHLAKATALRQAGQVGQSFKSLAQVKEALSLARTLKLGSKALLDVRNEAIACLCLPDFEVFKEWDGWPTGTSGFALDPAFRLYARGDKDGEIAVRRLSDDRLLYRIPAAGIVSDYGGLQFSPDERFLHRICDRGRSRLYKLDGSQAVPVLPDDDDHRALIFRPDGRQFAAGYPNGWIRLFDSETGKELRSFAAGLQGNFQLLWNPKFPRLVFGSKRDWRLLDLENGAIRRLALPPGSAASHSCVDWHPQGRILAVSFLYDDLKIYLWDTVRDRLKFVLREGHGNEGIVMRFSHGGNRLLSSEWFGTWRLWDTWSGQQILKMPGGSPAHMHFSANDDLVAVGWAPPKMRLFRFRAGCEFRTLILPGVSGGDRYGYIATHGVHSQKGRLHAVRTADDIALVDLACGELVARVRGQGISQGTLGFEPDGSLWTFGKEGLFRWPCASGPQAGRRRFGPPERMGPAAVQAKSADGKVLAIAAHDRGAIVFHRDSQRRWRVGPQQDVRSCAVSPNGRWLATGSHTLHEGGGAKVWDLSARPPRHVKDLPVGGLCGVQFSPDGKWLLTQVGGGGPRLWKADTWEEGPALGGNAQNPTGAFSADGKLLALGDEPGVVRLVVPASGEEIARLTAPVKSPLLPSGFSPDAAELITFGSETGAIHIFDLRAIRCELAELGLDWDPSSIPPAPKGPVPFFGPADSAPLQVEVDTGDLGMTDADRRSYWQRHIALNSIRRALNPFDIQAALKRGRAYAHLGKNAQAVDDFARALVLLPPDKQAFFAGTPPAEVALTLNTWAWSWAVKSASKNGPAQSQKALFFAQKAVDLAPDQWLYRNTLGVVHYRLGNYAEAVKHLELSLHANKSDTAAFDLFFLAMCHQRLGDAAKVRDCYDQAVRWVEQEKADLPQGWIEELKGFRAEAAEVLRLANR